MTTEPGTTQSGRRKLTDREAEAIKSLKRLAKVWPKTLMLFSASGTLCVMPFPPVITDSGGMDGEAVLDEISGIPNDGGDW